MGEPSTHPGRDESPTVAEPAASSRRLGDLSSISSASGSRVTSVITPRETLHLQEIARTRAFVIVAAVFAVLVALCLLLLGGDPLAKDIFLVASAAIIVSCGWLAWELRRDEGYTIQRATVVAYISIVSAFAGIWYFGVFSPAAAIIPFGLSFFSIGQSTRAVLAVYLTCAFLQAGLMLLVASGAVRDMGLIQAHGLSHLEQVMVMLILEGVFFATYVVQRKTRQATLDAIEQHDRVVRSLAQRDALLREARQDLAHALQAGGLGRWSDEIVGGFRLGGVLGRGAMGEVYEAASVQTGEPAAVKLLHPHVLAQADLVQRFLREARIVAGLNAANVVRVLEVSPPDVTVPWLAMERLTGHDLADHLREHKRMGVKGVLTLLRHVGLGLEAARRAGVVHRDLKPRNLFLSSKGNVWKILDFGVARLTGDETLTQNQIVGTPNYMAPEQAKGAAVTHRTDLFALGIIAYRALTGQPAFEGDMTPEILFKVVHAMPQRPSELVSVHPDVDLVLAVALAKDPANRFDSAAEMAQALDAAARGKLDDALRARAEKLLARLPWGAEE
ncbi:MAG TPA: serine/threonine-protein kinase [Polyangiaceae bacterium]